MMIAVSSGQHPAATARSAGYHQETGSHMDLWRFPARHEATRIAGGFFLRDNPIIPIENMDQWMMTGGSPS